jgi:hypothetical protein
MARAAEGLETPPSVPAGRPGSAITAEAAFASPPRALSLSPALLVNSFPKPFQTFISPPKLPTQQYRADRSREQTEQQSPRMATPRTENNSTQEEAVVTGRSPADSSQSPSLSPSAAALSTMRTTLHSTVQQPAGPNHGASPSAGLRSFWPFGRWNASGQTSAVAARGDTGATTKQSRNETAAADQMNHRTVVNTAPVAPKESDVGIIQFSAHS